MTFSRSDHARAAFVALHLVAVVLIAVPEPNVRPDDLNKPSVQAWFERSADQLDGWGIHTDSERLTQTAVRWGGAWLSVRDVVAPPAAAYARWVGARQHWGMFGTVKPTSALFFVEVEQGGVWQRVYESRSATAAWQRSWFDHERVRAFENQFTRQRNKRAWHRWTTWMQGKVSRDFPSATHARMGMVSITIPGPQRLSETRALDRGETFWLTDLELP